MNPAKIERLICLCKGLVLATNKKLTGWGRLHTFAVNYPLDGKPDETYAQWAVAGEHIIGIYIKEWDELTYQEHFAKAAAEMTEMEIKLRKQGEEWRGGDRGDR